MCRPNQEYQAASKVVLIKLFDIFNMKSHKRKEESINSIKEYFILLHDKEARKKTDVPFLSKTVYHPVTKGSLWFSTFNHALKDRITLHCVDNKDICMDYNKDFVKPLEHIEFQFLLAISNCTERCYLYKMENEKLKKAVDLVKSQEHKSGNTEVKVGCEHSNRFVLGILLAIQTVEGRPGLWLRIGFKNNKNRNPERFETLSAIREFISKNPKNFRQTLDIGDRVVWISDRDVPEYGTVRWCGILDEYSDQYSYGVEFDNPVGSGMGQLAGVQLFRTRMNHASFIPAMGLMRAEEFDSPLVSMETSEGAHMLASSMTAFTRNREQKNVDLSMELSTFGDKSHYLKSTGGVVSKAPKPPLDDRDLRSEARKTCSSEKTSPSKYDSHIAIDAMVQVDIPGLAKPQSGRVRWKGCVANEIILGIELEEPCLAATNGSFDNEQKFTCAPKRGYFAKLSKVRFIEDGGSGGDGKLCPKPEEIGSVDCPEVTEAQACLFAFNELDLLNLLKRHTVERLVSKSLLYSKASSSSSAAGDEVIGRNLGIQGYYNSCYMDVTLFSMFAFNHGFDSVLHRKKTRQDVLLYEEIRSVLRNEIVNPLRRSLYVRADKMLKLRQLISRTSSISGFLTDGKDPEEFLQCLFKETLITEPFVKFSSGSSVHFFQLIVNGNEGNDFTTTQELLKSCLSQLGLSFTETPSSLILQLPRCGQSKVFNSIMPSLYINLGTIQKPALCFLCESRSCFVCNNCRQESNGRPLEFCRKCSKDYHLHLQRKSHQPYYIGEHEVCDQSSTTKCCNEILELFSVICIRTSHYVCFVKCGLLPDSPWAFFDSMADRSELDGGYNIPRITTCSHIPKYIHDPDEFRRLPPGELEQLPEEVTRFVCDGYICMYRSIELLNYR